MARLHEFQGKKLLKKFNITIPEGKVVSSPEEAMDFVSGIGKSVVLKAQIWTTKRASIGGIQFADTPEEAFKKAKKLFSLKIKNFYVEKVLVEEKLKISQEFYTGIIIDDSEKKLEILFSSVGGTGIEKIAKAHPDKVAKMYINIRDGLRDYHARNLVLKTGIHGKLMVRIADTLVGLWKVAKGYDARSVEINPLVLTEDGNVYAADCRIAIDDYSVYRHPELGIEIAREFDHPPTELEKIAFNVEKNDHRGTFYFIQLHRNIKKDQNYIGFHGAGGGGSMMSMDAVNKKGFKTANFTDTSGNPSASKVYRAAKIILSQKGIDGYFVSGSGVASQEQTNSARGIVRAFREENLSVPAVIRLGGNQEDLAVEILAKYTKDLPGHVEGYKKDDSADFCAERLKILVDNYIEPEERKRIWKKPIADRPYSFETLTGSVTFDYAKCEGCVSKACIEACKPEILKIDGEYPVLTIPEKEAKAGKCTECLACELTCEFEGNKGAYIDLPIPGLEEYRKKYRGEK